MHLATGVIGSLQGMLTGRRPLLSSKNFYMHLLAVATPAFVEGRQ